ncbi:hypothetical protein I4U23_027522 [Adineta vaga]|nr:hypothetical protein I4U23_027522 [Adineta vaga]
MGAACPCPTLVTPLLTYNPKRIWAARPLEPSYMDFTEFWAAQESPHIPKLSAPNRLDNWDDSLVIQVYTKLHSEGEKELVSTHDYSYNADLIIHTALNCETLERFASSIRKYCSDHRGSIFSELFIQLLEPYDQSEIKKEKSDIKQSDLRRYDSLGFFTIFG